MKKQNELLKIDTFGRKSLNAASKGHAKVIQNQVTAIKKDRKTLRSVVQYLCTTDTAEAVQLRDYLRLSKNANKEARNNAVTWINANLAFYSYINVIREGVATTEKIAVTKSGRYISDQLDSIKLIAQNSGRIKLQRQEMLAYLLKARNASKKAKTYDKALPVLIDTAKQAPAKYTGIEIEARFVLVDGVTIYPNEEETLADLVALYATADTAE